MHFAVADPVEVVQVHKECKLICSICLSELLYNNWWCVAQNINAFHRLVSLKAVKY